jgi:hypothetical protein
MWFRTVAPATPSLAAMTFAEAIGQELEYLQLLRRHDFLLRGTALLVRDQNVQEELPLTIVEGDCGYIDAPVAFESCDQ